MKNRLFKKHVYIYLRGFGGRKTVCQGECSFQELMADGCKILLVLSCSFQERRSGQVDVKFSLVQVPFREIFYAKRDTYMNCVHTNVKPAKGFMFEKVMFHY